MLTVEDAPANAGDAPAALAVIGVRAGYGRIEVLHGIDLALHPGAMVAVLGPNGAGKSTLLAVMSGLLRPRAGCLHVAGHHVNGAPVEGLARAGVSLVREGPSVFPNLTVDENLVVASTSGGSTAQVQGAAYDLFPHLYERRSQKAGTLSGGEKQMLALGAALGSDPAVLLVDELSMGLAPKIVEHLYETVAAVAVGGVAVLVVEQFAAIALRYAATAIVMSGGRVTFDGPSEAALAAVDDAYLGGTG